MKIPILFTGILLAAFPLHAESPPEPVRTERLEDIRATLQMPEKWHLRRDEEEGVIVYQVTREKLEEAGSAFQAGFTLSVTPDVPGRTGLSPSQYAAELLAFAAEEGGEVKKTESPPFQTLRAEYTVDGEAGRVTIVDVAIANDSTGTLAFLAWQAPESESASLGPLRELILNSVVFDAGP